MPGRIIQSLKKMGNNNPNYGKYLSDNHALNNSVSTTSAKRAKKPNLTNEKIEWNGPYSILYDGKGLK
jgi:hypothetical protein